MKKAFSAIVWSAVFLLGGCAGQMTTYENDPSNFLLDPGRTALCVPLDSVHVTYVDNTASRPDTLFNDSFFIAAANGLLSYEVSRDFRVIQPGRDGVDSLFLFKQGGFSRLDHDTARLKAISAVVMRLAHTYHADLVVIPYALTIKHVTIRPRGWRNDRFGPSYERPVSYSAKTGFHVQIWDNNGRLIYEREGRSDTGRPILYSFLKREKHPDKDIVKYAKRFYAPPLVKSLYNSIKLALMLRM